MRLCRPNAVANAGLQVLQCKTLDNEKFLWNLGRCACLSSGFVRSSLNTWKTTDYQGFGGRGSARDGVAILLYSIRVAVALRCFGRGSCVCRAGGASSETTDQTNTVESRVVESAHSRDASSFGFVVDESAVTF